MLLQKSCDLFAVHSTSSSRKYLLVFLFSYCATFSGLLVLHGHDMAVRVELHIERTLRTVKHRIPLDLRQILHGLPTVGAGIFQTHVLILLLDNKKALRRTVIKTG